MAERGPLISRGICPECGEPIYPGEARGRKWFTCSICGRTVCEDCRKEHIMHCFAETWGLMEKKDGEWVQVEKPRQFAIK
jgi:hypothetical protein